MGKKPPTSLYISEPNHGLVHNNRNWFIIDWDSGIKRFNKVLKLYHIYEQSDINRDVFLVFGYKILTAGEKETYFFIRDLALFNEKINDKYSCMVSQDYIAVVLGTSRSQQARRIKKLIKVGLLHVDRQSSSTNSNTYIPMRWALPDSTLLSTIIILIRRKHMYELCKEYDDTRTSPQRRKEIVEMARKIDKKIPNSTNLVWGDIKAEL